MDVLQKEGEVRLGTRRAVLLYTPVAKWIRMQVRRSKVWGRATSIPKRVSMHDN